MRGVAVGFAVAAVSYRHVRAAYNELCFGTASHVAEKCCDEGGHGECWVAEVFSEEFCCHPLPPRVAQCTAEIAGRLQAKIHSIVGRLEAAGGSSEGMSEEASFEASDAANFSSFYEILLSTPILMRRWACDWPPSPALWSDGCACCDPYEPGACEVKLADRVEFSKQPELLRLRAECCYPAYSRRAGQDACDPALDAAIERHLVDVRPAAGLALERGSALEWRVDGNTARGCPISVEADGSIRTCDEAHACPGFDCSYLRAFVEVLRIIQATRPLPKMDLVLNAADFTPQAAEESKATLLRVFTRTGVKGGSSIALPFEWQLHPSQCSRHIRQMFDVATRVLWEAREPKLIWRGSPSNCFTAECAPALAEGSNAAMRACAAGPQGRVCRLDHETWLQMPRGRLVWLSRFFPQGVDARFVLSGSDGLGAELRRFLEREGLIVERMHMSQQAAYKYVIAIEGAAAADRLYWQLFSGSVVLVPDSPWSVFAVTDLLQPFVHYVPIRYDLSDLVEKVVWLQAHDDEARAIASNALSFAQRYLSCESIVYFVDRLLRRYAAHLTAA